MAELLTVPLKSASDVDIVKPLKNIIQSTYTTGESGEECNDALSELARLRANAIWKVFDKSSLEVIYSYYDQLVSLESKVPAQEVQIPFKWKDAFDKGSIFGGRRSLTISSLAFERMCVLFNMAALQSSMAAAQSLDTEESLKLAAKLLQQAAGILEYLKANIMLAVHQETTPDLQPDTLGALALLMLAQAQEVIVHKCIRDEMKESTVAKVCAACDELYTDALRALGKEHLKPLWERDWLGAVAGKQVGYRGLAHYYQSLLCRANGAVGEEIARLQTALELLQTASARPHRPALFAETATRASRRLTEATKDNDFIYHERVPDSRQLEPVGRATVAKSLPPQDRWGAGGRDLFGWLVPLSVQHALAASDARRAAAVSAEVNRLRDATQLMNTTLASLNLPAACERDVEGGALPDSILGKARAVRDAGGLAALRGLTVELPELLQRNRDILDETDRMLREEEDADRGLRAQFGARWARTESAVLTEPFRANAAKYRQIIDDAVRADTIVQQKFKQHEGSMALLSGTEEDMRAGVPAAERGRPADSAPAAALRGMMEDVETIKAERDVIEAELKGVTLDLRGKLSEGGDEPALTEAALAAALGPLQAQARDSVRRQERLMADVRRAHEELSAAGAVGSDREDALGALCCAHDAYQELHNNLTEGVKFYNDLTQLLVAFQNKVSDFCFARKTEKEELLKDLTQDAARGTSRPAPSPPAPPATSPGVSRTSPPAPPAATAPLPYPARPQGMPLPYSAPSPAYHYYQPPMPALYNPYATLPYPHSGYTLPPAQYPPPPGQYPPPSGQYPPPPASGYNPYPQQ